MQLNSFITPPHHAWTHKETQSESHEKDLMKWVLRLRDARKVCFPPIASSSVSYPTSSSVTRSYESEKADHRVVEDLELATSIDLCVAAVRLIYGPLGEFQRIDSARHVGSVGTGGGKEQSR